jgi:hypothetical protein
MTPKLREELADLVFDDWLRDAGKAERERLDALISDLRGRLADDAARKSLDAIEEEAIGYALMLGEAAFLAGLDCGRDIRLLVCE